MRSWCITTARRGPFAAGLGRLQLCACKCARELWCARASLAQKASGYRRLLGDRELSPGPHTPWRPLFRAGCQDARDTEPAAASGPRDPRSARGAAVWPPATTRGRGLSAGACPWQEPVSPQGRAVTGAETASSCFSRMPGSHSRGPRRSLTPHRRQRGAKVSVSLLQPPQPAGHVPRLLSGTRPGSSPQGYPSSLTLVYVQGREAENRAVRKP